MKLFPVTIRGAALALGLGLLVADPADAAPLRLTSSMSAYCVDVNCNLVRFKLQMTQNPSAMITKLSLVSDVGNGSPWAFDAFTRVADGNGYVLYDENNTSNQWTQSTNATQWDMGLFGSGTPGQVPLYVEVRMASAGQQRELDRLHYRVEGDLGGQAIFSGGNVVTPEPVTMLLLGSGLVGVAGAAARRRRLTVDEE